MKVREFLETLALNNYFAISINELVDSKEYSSGELSIVVYDTKNIINMLSDTILNKTFSHAHIDINDDNEIELYIYVLKEMEKETSARILRAFSNPIHDDILDSLVYAKYLIDCHYIPIQKHHKEEK